MKQTIELKFDVADITFIRSAIMLKAQDICDYITFETEEYIDGIQEEEEIKDIEIDEFIEDLKKLIEKEEPETVPVKKVGRPKGSKNAK